MRCVGQKFVKREDVTGNLQRHSSKAVNMQLGSHRRLNVTTTQRRAGIFTCIYTNEKWISREQNPQRSAKFIFNTAEPAVSPSRAVCQKTAMLARKQPLLRLEKKQKKTKNQLLIIVMKNTMGIFWARADARLLFLFLISAAAIWDMAERASECSRRQVIEAKSRLRPEQRPKEIKHTHTRTEQH